MKTEYLLVHIILALLAACSPAVNQSAATPTATAQVPTGTPSDIPVTVPDSLSNQESILRLAGYRIQTSPDGVKLVDPHGQSALRSLEANTVVITTENDETLTFPQEAFEVRKTIGAGVEQILTVKSPEGAVEYFYLDRSGEWVTPIEQQTDPREIENYTEATMEDVWSGRMLYSELLNAQEFPAGTLVPDEFSYKLWRTGGGGYYVKIQHAIDGESDVGLKFNYEIVKHGNDYRRWVAFYQSQTPEGVDVLIGTEQVLSTDGKTSIFFHYIFGPEWPWTEDYHFSSGRTLNLVDNVFQATDPQVSDPSQELGRVIRPVITVTFGDPQNERRGLTVLPNGLNGPPAAGGPLYLDFQQNNPVLVRDDLAELITKAAEVTGPNVWVAYVGPEISELQYMYLMGTINYIIPPEYYQDSK